MPKFTVESPTSLDPKSAFEKLKAFMETDEGLKKIDPKMQCSFNDSALNGKVNGAQFKADIRVVETSSSCKVQIDVDIPFILTPLKGKIQETLTRKLSKLFA